LPGEAAEPAEGSRLRLATDLRESRLTRQRQHLRARVEAEAHSPADQLTRGVIARRERKPQRVRAGLHDDGELTAGLEDAMGLADAGERVAPVVERLHGRDTIENAICPGQRERVAADDDGAPGGNCGGVAP